MSLPWLLYPNSTPRPTETGASVEEIWSSSKPQRDEGEADRDARERQAERIGFSHGRHEPLSGSNQDESRHHKHHGNEQCLDRRRHGPDAPQLTSSAEVAAAGSGCGVAAVGGLSAQ